MRNSKGLSPIVAELILIAISLLLAVFIYAWTMSIVNKLSTLKFMRTIYPVSVSTPLTDCYGGSCLGQHVLIILQFASTEQAQLGSISVSYEGSTVCALNAYVKSVDAGRGLCLFGYYGSTRNALDGDDVPPPGAVFFGTCSSIPSSGSVSYLDSLNLATPSYSNEVAPPWATVVYGSWSTVPVSTNKVETDFVYSAGSLKFSNLYSSAVKVAYYPNNSTWIELEGFKSVTVSGGSWALLVWCPNVNALTMDKVRVTVTINGMQTEVDVPLGVS